MMVKATRKGYYQVIREEGSVFMFTAASGDTAKAVEKSSWLEKASTPVEEDVESE